MINNCSLSKVHFFEGRSIRNHVYSTAQVETHTRVPSLKIQGKWSAHCPSPESTWQSWKALDQNMVLLPFLYWGCPVVTFQNSPKLFAICCGWRIISRSTYINRQTKRRKFVTTLSLFRRWMFGLASLFKCINSELHNWNPTYRFHRVKIISVLSYSSYKNVVLPGEALFPRTIPLWN